MLAYAYLVVAAANNQKQHGWRALRRIAKAAGLDAARWTPHERHSFVSLLSDDGMSVEAWRSCAVQTGYAT